MSKFNDSNKSGSGSSSGFVRSMLFSFLVGIVAFFILVSAFSLMVTKRDISFDSIKYLLSAASVLSAFIAGYIMSRRMKVRGLFSGISVSIPLFLFEIIFVVILSDGLISGAVYLLIPMMIFASALGGIMAANMKQKRKFRH